MQLDSRHAKAPGLRPRTFASPQTTDARWLPIHLHALSSTRRWRDPARQRRRIAAIPFSSSLAFLVSGSMVTLHPYLPSSKSSHDRIFLFVTIAPLIDARHIEL